MDAAQLRQKNHCLRQERIARNWRQSDLADQLETTVTTVRRWERGSQQPSAYFRVKLCALFGKSAEELGFVSGSLRLGGATESEADLLVEAVPVPASPMYWQVPLRRNPFFTGRSAILTHIHDYLSPKREDVQTRSLALCGLGGIGKTQIVLEYAYHYAQEYTAVFWITAETSEGIITGFTSIATQLHLLEATSLDHYTIVAAVLSWFTTHHNWLLIVDNVEDVALIKPFLPAARYGAFLLTTRLQAVGTLAYSLKLEHMTREEGAKLLLYRAGRVTLEEPLERACPLDIALACSITEALDGFPLAIDQAGAYIEEVQCSLDEYYRLYQSSPYFLLNQSDTSSDHPKSAARTFLLAFEQVQRRLPSCRRLPSPLCFSPRRRHSRRGVFTRD